MSIKNDKQRLKDLANKFWSLSDKYEGNFVDVDPDLHDQISLEHRKLFKKIYPLGLYHGITKTN